MRRSIVKKVRGKPKWTWFDDVREDRRILKDWRSTAMDRDA
jgi:hypothetical protein